MKKSILIILSLLLCVITQAQVSKTITGLTAGGLYSGLTATELSTVTNLTLTGTIDARDFKTMRDSMPVLAVVDLSGTTVVEYKGMDGTLDAVDTTYIANAIPELAFCVYNGSVRYVGKKTLVSFVWPSSVSVIGADAFDGCSGLAGKISIPSTVDSIGNYAFYKCTALTAIELPSSLKQIPEGCFEDAGLVGELLIPSSVEIIGSTAYSGCAGLTSLILPVSLTSIASYAFNSCTGLHTVNIPSSVTFIGSDAFANCIGLSKLSIPSSVKTIDSGAFSGCTGLSSIKVAWTTPISIAATVFGNVDKTNCTLYVPEGYVATYDAATVWTDFINIKEDVLSEIENTSTAAIMVRVLNGQVLVTGASSGEEITLYNLQGLAICSQKANVETAAISLPAHGMYVLKVGKQSVKVIY